MPRDTTCRTPCSTPCVSDQTSVPPMIFEPTEEYPASCAYCGGNVYGVLCCGSDGKVVHYGCWSKWCTQREEHDLQTALGEELRSLKRHLKNERRKAHRQEWERTRPKRCKPVKRAPSQEAERELKWTQRRHERHRSAASNVSQERRGFAPTARF